MSVSFIQSYFGISAYKSALQPGPYLRELMEQFFSSPQVNILNSGEVQMAFLSFLPQQSPSMHLALKGVSSLAKNPAFGVWKIPEILLINK